MGVAAAREKSFGKRKAARLPGNRWRAGLTRKWHEGVAEWCFDAKPGGTCQNIASACGRPSPKRIIGRVLQQHAPEINFGSKMAISHTGVNRGIAAASRFQIVIAAIANDTDAGNSHARRQRE